MNPLQAMSLTEKDLVTSILSSFYIVDYGYINKVNPDKTVNITHAARQVMLGGEVLGETTTDNVEVLTISGAGFSVQWDYRAGDKVLILGLKDYVPRAGDVSKAEKPKAFFHYDRSTIKAVPLCVFSEEAKVRISAKDGELSILAEGTVTVETEGDVSVSAKNATVECRKLTVKGDLSPLAALEVTP